MGDATKARQAEEGFMTAKNEKNRFPVACANCGKTTWVAGDELRYCPPCYRKVERHAGGVFYDNPAKK